MQHARWDTYLGCPYCRSQALDKISPFENQYIFFSSDVSRPPMDLKQKRILLDLLFVGVPSSGKTVLTWTGNKKDILGQLILTPLSSSFKFIHICLLFPKNTLNIEGGSLFNFTYPWNNHPYHETQGLVRKRAGHWTILRAVAKPVPDRKSNPIQSYRPLPPVVVSLFSNLVVVAVMLLRPQKLRSTHVLIMALAASDIMFSLVIFMFLISLSTTLASLTSWWKWSLPGGSSDADCHQPWIRCCHPLHKIRSVLHLAFFK